jgi:hypothetical protein
MNALEVIGGALLGGKVVEKVLGPTAEYLGEGIKTFAEKRVENIRNIFDNAQKKLGDRINSPGAVPPRVLAGILNDGSYRDDKVATEYYGGVLASSRTEISRDDRGATLVSLVSRLSSYQLRVHYIIYRTFLELYSGSNTPITQSKDRVTLKTLIPESTLLVAMDFSESEPGQMIMEHALVGLSREELFAPHNWAYGGGSLLQQRGYNGPERGLIVEPTPNGVELFLNGMGGGYLPINAFLWQGTFIPAIEGITIPSGSISLKAISSNKETGHSLIVNE